jgi:hypothetical protein
MGWAAALLFGVLCTYFETAWSGESAQQSQQLGVVPTLAEAYLLRRIALTIDPFCIGILVFPAQGFASPEQVFHQGRAALSLPRWGAGAAV